MPRPADSLLPVSRERSLDRWGILFSLFCAIVLAAQLIHQNGIKPLWLDEQFTRLEVQGKTFTEVIHSLRTGVNLQPPAYFLALWTCLQFTEFTPLLARALSCIFILATVPVMWMTLRPMIGRGLTTASVGGVLFCSPLIFYHNSEARPYGLFFFAAALVAWAFVRSLQEERLTKRTFALLVFANAFLPSVIYYGGFYAGAALAVTVGFDLIRGRRRWRIYGGYLCGWSLFGLIILPLCLAQLQSRGGEGTRWLPEFRESVLMLAKQWVKTVVPFVAIGFLFAAWLWFSRREPKANAASGSGAERTWWPIATLGLAWLALPILFIGQSVVTHRNLYLDRYFIPSDLGFMLLFAGLASAACVRTRGAASLERCLTSSRSRIIAMAVITAFVGIVSLRFYRNARNALWGFGDTVYAAKIGIGPKATFSLAYYVEGYVRTGPGMQFVYLSHYSGEGAALATYCRGFDTRTIDEMAVFPEFVFVDSSDNPSVFDLEDWARRHQYNIRRFATYGEAHAVKKGIYQMTRVQKAVADLGPLSLPN